MPAAIPVGADLSSAPPIYRQKRTMQVKRADKSAVRTINGRLRMRLLAAIPVSADFIARTADLSARHTRIVCYADKSAVRTINGRLRMR